MTETPVSAGTLSAGDLRAGLLGGGAYLEHNYRLLDNLNVFPVPDGDTGTNMLVTYRAGMSALQDAQTMREVAEAMHEPMIRQSRGNSGFILARFFNGFFEVLGHEESPDASHVAGAFARGSYRVNTSLFAPVEGTMITIISAMAAALHESAGESVEAALESALVAARAALFETPKVLAVLASAGVVDAGALGFIFIVDGFLRGLRNEPPAREEETSYRFAPDEGAAARLQPNEAMHRYCTEASVRLHDNSGLSPESSSELADFLRSAGSSIALVQEAGIIKVHIHTDAPERVIGTLESLGTVMDRKIEDMRDQMGLISQEEDPDSNNSVISCVPGEGFAQMFSSLGIERCVVYQTALPSAADLLEAINESKSNNVIVLPNNKNILPTAMLARDRSERNVSILASEDVVQGLAAVYGFSENATMKENIGSMAECMELVRVVNVYRSVADTEFGGTRIQKNDYFCISGGAVLSVDSDPFTAASAGLAAINPDEFNNLCIYTSGPESGEVARRLEDRLGETGSRLEIECLHGGQSREYLILSLE